MAESAARTLADQLRAWPDDALGRLLTARPDLATPAPQDSTQLASRAGTRASCLRAVDQLTVLELTVLDALIGLGGRGSRSDLRSCVAAQASSVDRAVARLLDLALVWGPVDDLRAVTVLTELVGTTVSGLGPRAVTLLTGYGPRRLHLLVRDLGLEVSGDQHRDIAAVAGHLADGEQVRTLLAEVDDRARRILEHLDREGNEGTVEAADRPVTRGDAQSPVDQLLARGLLVARDRRHVTVPWEVGLRLRGGHTTRDPADDTPALAVSAREAGLVDRAGAGAAHELVRHVELLLEHWGMDPPAVLRGGGLGVRDLRAAAQTLHLDEAAAALHVEVAAAAGLLAVGHGGDLDSAWLPTDAFDVWAAQPMGERWARLALAWLENLRLTGLVGGRDDRNKPVNALGPDLERGWLPETRRTALEELASLPDGEVLAAGTGTPSLVARLRWLRPRRPAVRAQAVAWMVDEAAVLGVTGLGGITGHGRALLTSDDPRHAAAAALEPLLPPPVDHVLLQADLTAVAPGPLEQELARRLSVLADVESRGGATVYRFTAGSVRRGFDSGWSAAEIHEFVATASRTPVPQPLVYLVDDVARRFGTVRAGAAESFLRSDDESALAELVHNARAASLRLRRIAPTVVVSDVPLDVLLARLRELGTAPVVEAPDGTVRLARREAHRARSPRPRTQSDGSTPSPADARARARLSARVGATVTAIRAGDRAAADRPSQRRHAQGAGASPTAVLAALREAADAKETVLIGYLDQEGSTGERIVEPVHVHGGQLTAYDHRSQQVRLFTVHRITGVHAMGAD